MRLSGIVLVVLVLGHLLIQLVLDGGVSKIGFAFVAGRWASPFWQVWDLLMLWLAMLHGANGLRTVINDYAERDEHPLLAEDAAVHGHGLHRPAGHAGDLHLRPEHPLIRTARGLQVTQCRSTSTTPSSSAPAAPACARPSSPPSAAAPPCSTKLYPTRSHTGAAQGGMAAALANVEEDNWEWHTFDTIKGGDYLVDQDAAEILAKEAIDSVLDLEKMGLPFNRTPKGTHRPAPVRRAHAATTARRRCAAPATRRTARAT